MSACCKTSPASVVWVRGRSVRLNRDRAPATPSAVPKSLHKAEPRGRAPDRGLHPQVAPNRTVITRRPTFGDPWHVVGRPGARHPAPRPALPSRRAGREPAGYSHVQPGGEGRRAVAVRFPRGGRRARLEPPVDAPPAPPAALRLRAFVLALLFLFLWRGEGHPRLLLALPDLGGHRARSGPSVGMPAARRRRRGVCPRRPFRTAGRSGSPGQPRAGKQQERTARPDPEQLEAGTEAESPPPPTMKPREQPPRLWLRGGSPGPSGALVLGKALPPGGGGAEASLVRGSCLRQHHLLGHYRYSG